MLNGTYYFRHALYRSLKCRRRLSRQCSSSDGTVNFSGTGTYTMAVTLLDGQFGPVSAGNVTGTYSIAASGQGFLSSPLFPGSGSIAGDSIYGLVNGQGIFVGSSTENQAGYNDVFIAAPLLSTVPTKPLHFPRFVFPGVNGSLRRQPQRPPSVESCR